jgi:hypothetical protein
MKMGIGDWGLGVNYENTFPQQEIDIPEASKE